MFISITKNDIEKGNVEFNSDPVTRALRRKFGKRVSVSRDYLRVSKKGARKDKFLLIELPTKAKKFIISYNAYAKVLPFKFELDSATVKLIRDCA